MAQNSGFIPTEGEAFLYWRHNAVTYEVETQIEQNLITSHGLDYVVLHIHMGTMYRRIVCVEISMLFLSQMRYFCSRN